MKKTFGIKKNIFLLGIVSFFNDFSSEMILSIFPVFFISILKAGAASLGLVEGVAEGMANFIQIYSGRWSDKMAKRKPFVASGYALSVITRPFYQFTKSVGGVIILRIMDRIGKGLRQGPRDAIISLSSENKDRGKSFGFHRMMDTLGAILGPLCAYLILSKYPGGFDRIFSLSFVVGILALFTIFFVKDIAGKARSKEFKLETFKSFTPNFKRYLGVIFVLSLGSLPVAILLLRTQEFNFSTASIPLFYMIYNFSYAAFSLPAGGCGDKFGEKKILTLGYIFLISSYIIFIFADSTVLFIVGFIMLGLFPAFTDGVSRAFASKLVGDDRRAGAYGLLNAGSGFGALIAGVTGGLIWQHFGAITAFLVSGTFILIGLILLSKVKNSDVASPTMESVAV